MKSSVNWAKAKQIKSTARRTHRRDRIEGHEDSQASLRCFRSEQIAANSCGKVITAAVLKLTVFIVPPDQNQLGGGDLSGKVKLKVEPLPTSLSTKSFPTQLDEFSG